MGPVTARAVLTQSPFASPRSRRTRQGHLRRPKRPSFRVFHHIQHALKNQLVEAWLSNYSVSNWIRMYPRSLLTPRSLRPTYMPSTNQITTITMLDYTFGIGMNARLKKYSDSLLETAVSQYEATGQPQRLFTAFWYRAESWPAQRWVVVKCEANAQGTNRRAVVTNRPGAFVLPGAAYDAYADRGESENRNKELKVGLAADRLSDHRYFANLFRLYLHTAAYNLLVRMRQARRGSACRKMLRKKFRLEALAGRRRRHITTAVANTIRSAKASPARGGRG